jgi:hypothetical protein
VINYCVAICEVIQLDNNITDKNQISVNKCENLTNEQCQRILILLQHITNVSGIRCLGASWLHIVVVCHIHVTHNVRQPETGQYVNETQMTAV